MTAPHLPIIMTDEYAIGALGCVGHHMVKTPNLDRLAGRGVRAMQSLTFDYTPLSDETGASLV